MKSQLSDSRDARPDAAPRRPASPATPLPRRLAAARPLAPRALLRDPASPLLASAGRLGPVTLARLGPVRAYLVTEPTN